MNETNEQEEQGQTTLINFQKSMPIYIFSTWPKNHIIIKNDQNYINMPNRQPINII